MFLLWQNVLSVFLGPACSIPVSSAWQKWGHEAGAERWGKAPVAVAVLKRAVLCTGITSYGLEQQIENCKEGLLYVHALGN